jgi:tetratricopeptide (TPR) repeat protein
MGWDGSGTPTEEAVYVGIGVGKYVHRDVYCVLPRAILDVKRIGGQLRGRYYRVQILRNPKRADADDVLDGLCDEGVACRPRVLVIYWSGHGELVSDEDLHLVTTDAKRKSSRSLPPVELARRLAETGASQILLILDACYSGAGVIHAMKIVDCVWNEQLQDRPCAWFGMVASTGNFEKARDGEFGVRLLQLLRDGPTEPWGDKCREYPFLWAWSSHNESIDGETLFNTLLLEWGRKSQQPKFAKHGLPSAIFYNPCHIPDAPEQVVEHLLLAAHGAAPDEEGLYFTGRRAQIAQIVGWMERRKPGIFVVTGPAGCGKSAIVGRIVSLSNTKEREVILSHAAGPLEHADPGRGSVHAHVHARGLTADQVVEAIDAQLVRQGMLGRVAGEKARRRNRWELYGALRAEKKSPVIAIDGLDEARSQAWNIVEEVIRPFADSTMLLVSTRELPGKGDGEQTLVQKIGAGAVVDLGDAALLEDTRRDVREYVTKRLAGIEAAVMDSEAVGNAVLRISGENREEREGAFLLARVMTSQLRAEPVDTSQSEWEEKLARSLEAAFDRDIAGIGKGGRDGEAMTPLAAREMLAALAWGYGSGLPDDLWPIFASALSGTEAEYARDDVFRALGVAGRYIIEGGEGGRAVYRLTHQRLIDHLRREGSPVEFGASNPSREKLAQELVDHYLKLLNGGHSPQSHSYLWQHAWRHCADAAAVGIGALRKLTDYDKDAFLPNLASALGSISSRYREVGKRKEAFWPGEESAGIYRKLSVENRAFLPDLASSLNNLGVFLSELGRRQEALGPAEEGTGIYRELSEENRAFLPDLAGSLNNLGVRYSELGRRQEALEPTQEAAGIYRELSVENRAFLPDLASSLNNLGNRYSELGRRQEALEPTQEAVGIYRELSMENRAFLPDLASSLNNLGISYSKLGRRQEALGPTEEAVRIHRELSKENRAFLPDLASSLNNLGISYSALGRRQEALGPTEEATGIYRELSVENRAFLPDLASSLNNLGIRYSELGRRQEALEPTQEAVGIFKELAAEYDFFQPYLAKTVNNLADRYSEVGREEDAAIARAEAERILGRDAAPTAG